MRLKTILIGVALVAVFFVAALKIMDYVAPRSTGPAPTLVELPPLPPSPPRSSTIVAPIAVALTAIRDVAERGAPRNFAGTAANPAQQVLQNADIKWTAARGPITAMSKCGKVMTAMNLMRWLRSFFSRWKGVGQLTTMLPGKRCGVQMKLYVPGALKRTQVRVLKLAFQSMSLEAALCVAGMSKSTT
jgi:hypothetical protein